MSIFSIILFVLVNLWAMLGIASGSMFAIGSAVGFTIVFLRNVYVERKYVEKAQAALQAELKRQYEQAHTNSFKSGGKIHDEDVPRENTPKGRIGFY